MSNKQPSRTKIIGVCIVVSIIFGLIGGIITNEYIIAYLFSNFIQEQEENSPIVKRVIEEHTFVEESLIIDAVKKVTPSLVTLYAGSVEVSDSDLFVSQTSDQFYLQGKAISNYPSGNVVGGTGFIISNDGLIATCSSLVGSQARWQLLTDDGTEYSANVVYNDSFDDIAFLAINAEEDTSYFQTLPFSENVVELGQKILSFGNDASAKTHVKSGIISNLIHKTPRVSKRLFPNEFMYVDFEIDSSLHCGPVVNLGGEVTGMVLDFDSLEEGTSYVIPVEAINSAFASYQKTIE
ncbi:serine protease [Patescibacteria group bacterium]